MASGNDQQESERPIHQSQLSRAKSLLHNVWTHDVTERLRIRRKTLARDAGLDPSYDVGTYPPHSPPILIEQRQKSGLGTLGSVLLGAGLLAGGGAGAVGLMSLLKPDTEAVVQPVKPETPKPGVDRDAEIEMEVIPPK